MSETGLTRVQQIASILWPSFVMAGVATGIFFSVVDPALVWHGPRIEAYSLGFFVFWAVTAASSLLTCFFRKPCS